MSHVDRWPMGGLKNSVIVAWQPMRGRENRLGQHIGTEVKKFVKDVMETRAVNMVLFYIG